MAEGSTESFAVNENQRRLGEANGRTRHLPEPEDVPIEAQHSARGLRRWLQKRRERLVPKDGYQGETGYPLLPCVEGCKMHDHDS